VQKAKKQSVPNENIDRALKRGSGQEAGADYQSIMYEGYGPGGIAVLVECLTDNRNRAASDVRWRSPATAARWPTPVRWPTCSPQGVVIVPKEGAATEDAVLSAVLDAGADEVNDLGDVFEVVCEPTDLVPVRTALQTAGLEYDSAESQFVPALQVAVDVNGARRILRLIDMLEDSDDVQNVFANFDASDEVLAELDAEEGE